VLASEVKIGKTRMIMELGRRLWYGLPFPDGAGPILPARTPSLWVCGDRHQDELRDMARDYGVPLEAVRLCARPENPYGNCILEEDDTIKLMAHYADVEGPGFIVIDTIWRATKKQMKVEEDVNAIFDPIIEIAQKTGCTIICASHLSKDGDTLGRRLEGAARSVMKLSYPDPDNQKDRRRLTTKGNFKQPDDLGLTLYADRVEFDHDPPKAPEPSWRGGRPASESNKAREFLFDTLRDGEQPSTDVIREWEDLGGSQRTLERVKKEMVEAGQLEVVRRFGASSLWKAIEPTAPADNQEEFTGLISD
jgi:hypothetical protein